MTTAPLVVPGKPWETVLNLMRQKRFFLAEDHKLDRHTFEEAIVTDRRISDLYRNHQLDWIKTILAEESALGMSPPVLEKDQLIVKCSRYTGGFDIVSVLGVRATLWHLIPLTTGFLHRELFALLYGDKDDIRPRDLSSLEDEIQRLSGMVMNQIAELNPESSVLILETRFRATSEEGLPAIRDRLKDLTWPNMGLAYLLFKNEEVSPMIRHGSLITLLNDREHAAIHHWDGRYPEFDPQGTTGYTYKVMVAVII